MPKEKITLKSETEVFEYLIKKVHDLLYLGDEIRSDIKELKEERNK